MNLIRKNLKQKWLFKIQPEICSCHPEHHDDWFFENSKPKLWKRKYPKTLVFNELFEIKDINFYAFKTKSIKLNSRVNIGFV